MKGREKRKEYFPSENQFQGIRLLPLGKGGKKTTTAISRYESRTQRKGKGYLHVTLDYERNKESKKEVGPPSDIAGGGKGKKRGFPLFEWTEQRKGE